MNWLSTTCIDSGEQLQEYINTFKLNVVRAKYNELKDATTLISYFSATLPTWIMHVTVRGCGLILSIVHLPPLTIDSPFTFTILIIFFADTFRYIAW